MHRYLRCFRDFAVENVAPAVVLYQSLRVRPMITSMSPEHACPRHDNVRVTRACMSAR